MSFPRIGLRIFKSAMAVFLCLLVDLLLRAVLPNNLAPDLYGPFFSSLAAIYSINNRRENSIHLAKIRAFGSVVGGGFGVAFLYGVFALLQVTRIPNGTFAYLLIEYVFIALGILLLFYLAVLLKLHNMVFIAGLTFLAVSVGNRTDLPYYMYAINRIGSTIIGVLISLGVNLLSFHWRKNKRMTFISSLDGVFLRDHPSLSNYQKYHLENLLEDGLDLYINTNRSPATLFKVFDTVEIKRPMVVMNGSATFDLREKHFDYVLKMDKKTEQTILGVLETHQLNYFAHVIADDSLHIYYRKIMSFGDEYFYKTRKNEYFRNFSKGAIPDDEQVSYFIVIAPFEDIITVQRQLIDAKIAAETMLTHYHELKNTDYGILRITSPEANKYLAFSRIKAQKEHEYLVAFGHTAIDLSYFEKAQERICFEDADPCIKAQATRILSGTSDRGVIRVISNLYYHKKMSSEASLSSETSPSNK